MVERQSIDDKIREMTSEQIDSFHGIYRVSKDEATRKKTTVKREDTPMWIVLEDEEIAQKIQRLLFPLKSTLEQLKWKSSFSSVVRTNMGGGIPYPICKDILGVMEEFDMTAPMTEQDIFMIEDEQNRIPQFTFFYDPDQENGYLSNWYLSHFAVEGKVYSSTEQFLMYYKANLFQDRDIASEIMGTDDLALIKKLGRQVKNYDGPIWETCRQLVLEEGLRAKFRQNEDLKLKLLDTKKTILAECSKWDMVWGIGISVDDETRFEMTSWRGENLLGKALMKIRMELK